MRVQASPEAVQLIQEQGGRLYVRAKRSRCCHGSLALLETSNEPAERSYRRVSADEIELYFDERLGDPEELVIEARGVGCANSIAVDEPGDLQAKPDSHTPHEALVPSLGRLPDRPLQIGAHI